MIEAVDIVRYSAPFVCGISAGLFFKDPFVAVGAFSILYCLFLLLGLRWGFTLSRIGATVFCAGALCGGMDRISSVLKEDSTGKTAAVTAVSQVIDSIPFSHSQSPALVKALLTGDRSSLDKEVIDAFRESGGSHILALSGLHLGMIYLLLQFLLSIIGRNPRAVFIRSAVVIFCCSYYTWATGASDSTVRALVFIILREVSRVLKRPQKASSVFCAALTLQLAISPQALLSLGFQLSYLAMAGIIFIYPHLEKWYPQSGNRGLLSKADIPRRMWQSAALSISCQITTAPLVWKVFGTFPGDFLLTNLLAMPLTSVVMVLSIALITLTSAGICPEGLVIIDDKALQLLINIMKTISRTL